MTAHSIDPHQVLAWVNFILGIAVIICNLVSMVATFATFQLLSFVVLLALVLGGLLIALASAVSCTCAIRYFGFVQFPAGTGSLFIFLGVINMGTGSVGLGIGITCIVWGCISLLAHLWLRTKQAAVHAPISKSVC